jgi:hypothetical protein
MKIFEERGGASFAIDFFGSFFHQGKNELFASLEKKKHYITIPP